MRHTVLLWGLLIVAFEGWAQPSVISLINPSFEDKAPAIKAPQGWFDAGFDGESPPDIQPGFFGCDQPPVHGESYVGLVTRDNGTWERIAQKLSSPLLKDSLYTFSICLSVAAEYKSPSRINGRMTNYKGPVVLRIWAVNPGERAAELLAESPEITNTQWVRYIFHLLPVRSDADIFLLEAYYASERQASNGHLLVDYCSDLVPAGNKPLADSLRQLRTKPEPFISRSAGLFNPSFEWGPNNVLPTGWIHTTDGFETLVRAHPAVLEDVYYLGQVGPMRYSTNVTRPAVLKAIAGNRYLSLLSSEDGKTQQVSQELDSPLKKDSAYSFSVYLARSKHFREYKTTDNKKTDYKNPLKLRIWGGTLQTPKMELLAESPTVVSPRWGKYEFNLKPRRQDYFCLTLEAWYVSDVGTPYNGNLLLDNCALTVKSNQ